ncbi:TPA: hypothetical protein ACH3X1_004722 [Trebouxia sp. C0004]
MGHSSASVLGARPTRLWQLQLRRGGQQLRHQQAQELRVTVAMDPSALLHQHGVSLDQLSDPSSVVAQAAQAVIANFDSMMHASDDDVVS